MEIKQFYPYSPRKADFEQLSYAFVARKPLLDELIDTIKEQADAEALQHWMILGMRGMGKSHLIALLYQTVRNNAELSQHWVPLLMHEEEQSVFSLHTLFIRFLIKLGDELKGAYKKQSDSIFDFLEKLRNEGKKQEDILESVVAFLKDFVKQTDKKLLVLMENSDDIFSRYISNKNDLKKLRNILQHDNFMLLIATSPTFFEGIQKPSAPLYQFFRIRNLELLTFEQSVELLNRWKESDAQLPENKSRNLQFDKNDYKLRALYHLTGGNPRVLLFLYMAIKGQDGIQSAVETFSKLLEEDLSNYYLSRLRDLSNQVQPIVLALAESDKNMTQKEIAQKTFLPMKSIGTAMLRLEKDNLVRPVTEKKGKNTLYTVTDHLFRLWHQWRIGAYNQEIIKAVVMCVAVWYKREELERWSKKDDLIGKHCKEALFYRTTDHFKSLWESLHQESETMIIKYLEKRDYKGFNKTLAMLQETGIESGKLLSKVIKNLENKGDVTNALKAVERQLKSNKEDKKAWFDKARLCLKQKNFTGAEEACVKAVELDPENSNTWGLLGSIRGEQKNFTGAEEALVKAVELDPENSNTWGLLGSIRGEKKNFTGAEEACVKAVELDPENSNTWGLLGSIRGDQKNFTGAEEAFVKAVELDPENSDAWRLLGMARIDQKNFTGAEEALVKAVELDPENSNAWRLLGRTRGGQKNFTGAEEAFVKAVELDPENSNTWGLLGSIRGDQKNFTGAEEAFVKAVELDPENSDAWRLLGMARIDQKNFTGAEEALVKAVELDPENSNAWRLLGRTRGGQKNFTGAEEAFVKAVELDPENSDAWRLLGMARIDQKNFTGAEEALVKAVELDPENSDAWRFLGFARGEQKNFTGAEEALVKAVELDPENSNAWRLLGRTRIEQKNFTGAEEAFVKAVELDPENSNAWRLLGRTRIEQKNFTGAEEAFVKAVELDPENSNTWSLLGIAHIEQKNFTGAEEAFVKAVELDPENSDAWRLLGFARGEQKNFTGAEEAFVKAVELDPENSNTWSLLGSVRFFNKNYQTAEAAFYENLRLEPFKKEGYKNLLEVLVDDDRVPDILPTIEDVLSLKGSGLELKSFFSFIKSFVFLYQQDRTPFLKYLKESTKYLNELTEEKKHEVLGSVSEFLEDTLRKKNIHIHRAYIDEVRKIDTELAGVFSLWAHVLDYFEVVFSDQKDQKAKTDKAQRIIDSITSEIREPVEKMIERIKDNLQE